MSGSALSGDSDGLWRSGVEVLEVTSRASAQAVLRPRCAAFREQEGGRVFVVDYAGGIGWSRLAGSGEALCFGSRWAFNPFLRVGAGDGEAATVAPVLGQMVVEAGGPGYGVPAAVLLEGAVRKAWHRDGGRTGVEGVILALGRVGGALRPGRRGWPAGMTRGQARFLAKTVQAALGRVLEHPTAARWFGSMWGRVPSTVAAVDASELGPPEAGEVPGRGAAALAVLGAWLREAVLAASSGPAMVVLSGLHRVADRIDAGCLSSLLSSGGVRGGHGGVNLLVVVPKEGAVLGAHSAVQLLANCGIV